MSGFELLEKVQNFIKFHSIFKFLNKSIFHLTTVSEDYPTKSFRYHPGLYKIRWSCCKNASRTALGCLVTTNWPEKNNNHKGKSFLCLFSSR